MDTSSSDAPVTGPGSPSASIWRIIFAILGMGFAGLIVWASLNADFGASFAAITADPWGVVSLADLYLGFFIFAAFVFMTDGPCPASFAWVIGLMVLGNLLAIVWLVLRWKVLLARLRGQMAQAWP